jgi:predicted ester cyclase
MSTSETRAVWERFVAAEQAWEDPELMVQVHAADCRIVAGGAELVGREALRAMETTFHAAFPDWKRDHTQVVIGDGAIAFRWHATATHTGPYLGHAPTNRRIDIEGASFLTIRGGEIVESVVVADPAAISAQLGIETPTTSVDA